MEKIKLIFIDIDNTLLDFDMAIRVGIEEGFKKYNLGTFNDEMFQVFERENNKLWEALERKEITFQDIKKNRFNIVFKYLGIDFDGVTFEENYRVFLHDFAYPVIGACEFLKTLKEHHYLIAVASNGPYEQQINRLKVAKMDQYIDYYFISEDIGASKPSKEFFDECFKRIKEKITINECVMVGDSLSSDIKGGKEYGMKTIFFNKHLIPSPYKIVPDYSFNSLKEISAFILDKGYDK